MRQFTGSGVALVTPFKGSKINFEVLKNLLDFHLDNETDFLVILGTTAETPTLSLKEKKAIIEFVVKYIDKRIPIMVGTGSNDTKSTISFSRIAQKLGADGILVVTPYYNKPTQSGLLAHYKSIAKAINLPLMMYNVPSRTGVNMLPETVKKLSKIKNIIGTKEASGNLNQVKQIIDETHEDFIVLSGNDDQVYDVLKLGGDGTISVTANIIPLTTSLLISNYRSGIENETAFRKYDDLHQMMFIESNPIPVKKALEHLGFEVGKPRLPLTQLSTKHNRQLVKTLKKYEIIQND
ncbi:4-hydroxy-tetrahydrodipicolinate synthase [Acholeplasma granularum]|uniref:4-hydroxy-tetrahydrodipicolinate synthase n=1 Tax=Acholeplasma granularum TaxID=264635 RepID=UPI00047018CF|nr:4-hydroxy-tetrahydrodipicolinate synthase [Acholeplasma granularum]